MDKENEDTCNVACTICSQRLSSYACVPCGHRCMCGICAENSYNELTTHTACPECGQDVNQLVLVLDC